MDVPSLGGSAVLIGIAVSDFSKLCTAYYFIYFIVILPLLGRFETPRPLPSSISEAVLKTPPATSGAIPAAAANSH